MANVQARDANGKKVQVHQAQFNNLGEVESIYIKQGNHMAWVHARDFDVTVDPDADQVVEQPSVMTKDTSFKPNRVLEKSNEGQALRDNANDESDADQPPVPPTSTPNPTVAPPAPVPTAPVEPPRELSPHEHVAPGGDFEPILDDTNVPTEPVTPPAAPPVEPVPGEQTKPADDGVLGKDDIKPPLN